MTLKTLFNDITTYISLGSLLTAALVAYIGNYMRKRFDAMEKKGETRVQETIIKMKALQAIGQLTYATSIAVKDGKVNGEMASAIETYRDAKIELDDFIIRGHAENKEG